MSEFFDRVSKLSPKRLAYLATELNAELERLKSAATEPLAVVGVGCRFPGGVTGPDSFWQLLVDGRDAITEVPPDRWDLDAYYDPDPDAPGKVSTRWGGFLDAVDQFDPDFFGIAPLEAVSMDPQHRLLLETTWRALEHAAISPARLAGTRTGVFIGCGNSDYGRLVFSDEQRIDAYAALGNSFSVAAGRLSYFLGVHGPALTVDTACSSSLVAVHLASRSLRAGECDLAIAGGVSLILSPGPTITLSKARMMSPDGRCKAFDASANGFVRAEGCGVVLLKRLSDARADGDRVLAVIRGSAVNQDGRSSGLTAPNGPAQVAVIREALANAGLEPDDVELIEAHGTGTSLGDPIEARAIAEVFGVGRTAGSTLRVGSLKTNIGHAEAAAGVAGLIKAVLALWHGKIPRSLHLKSLNPYIDWKGLPIEVATSELPWQAERGKRVAGVSSFGFSGTNVHVVVSDFVEPEVQAAASMRPPSWLLTLSARSESALAELAAAYEAALARVPAPDLADVSRTASAGRSHFEHRLAIAAATTAEAAERLADHRSGRRHSRIRRGQSSRSARPPVVFMFTGQGAQSPGMGRQLFDLQPVFRRELERCAEILDPLLDEPLLEILFSGASRAEPGTRIALDETQRAQPALFALEYALAMMWRSFGVEPTYVLGHSVGEYVAACVAGVFSLEDGLTLIAERGRLMASLPAGGAMAAVHADEGRVERAVRAVARGACEIACYNGPSNVVISGDGHAVDAVVASLRQEGIESTRLAVSHAFHSPLVEPVLDALESAAAKVTFQAPRIAVVSNLTGEIAAPDLITTPRYWRRHAREPVRFAQSIAALTKAGQPAFLEIGPHPVLTAMARSIDDAPRVWAHSLERNRPDWDVLLDGVAELYVSGVNFDWEAFHAPYGAKKVDLPGHPFQRRRFWIERASTRAQAAHATEEIWRRARDAGLRQSQNAPLGVRVETYPEKFARLARLTTAHAANTLSRLGAFAQPGERHDVDSLIRRLGISALYARMLQRWLERLADEGLLRRDGSAFVSDRPLSGSDLEPAMAATERALADDPHFLAYVRNCSDKLTDVIAGRESPLETLFPGGSSTLADNLYAAANINRYTNAVAGAAVEAAFRTWSGARPFRVLEVGAGTGGTTATMLPLLDGGGCEYLFTDVSDLFLARARRKFAAFPFARFAVLNLDEDLEAQGYVPCSFDVIVGANVVHASKDLRKALERLNSLLSPGGFLVLVEATEHHAWFDFTTGLIEGWQHFADDIRGDNPLLKPEQWQRTLTAHAFDDVVVLPSADSPASALGQHVILARTARSASKEAHLRAGSVVMPGDVVATPVGRDARVEGAESEGVSEEAVRKFLAELEAAAGGERIELMIEYVRERVMEVLQLDDAHRPDRTHRLMDLGLDSLMAVQLRNRLEAGLGLERALPATLMFDYPTIEAIAEVLVARLFGAANDSAEPGAEESFSRSQRARDIESLSEDEAEARLLERLDRLR